MLSEESDRQHEFTVAWVDCAARGQHLGRGILLSGDFAPASAGQGKHPRAHGRLDVPFTPPISLINPLSLRAFNALYARKPERRFLTHYEPFFYPLDAIGHWNRIYGPKGFLQYQCVLPPESAETATRELLERIAASGQGSFLAVLKGFGTQPQAGLLSFARAGVTIALDFPFRGARTSALLNTLDAVVVAVDGALYAAKDARMSQLGWGLSTPRLEAFGDFIDHSFVSGLWCRLNACG